VAGFGRKRGNLRQAFFKAREAGRLAIRLLNRPGLDQCYGPKQARWQWMQVIHALGSETRAVTCPKKPIIGQRLAGQFVDRRVRDDDAKVVGAGMKEARDVDTIRRAPDYSGALAIDIHLGGFADRRVEVGSQLFCPGGDGTVTGVAVPKSRSSRAPGAIWLGCNSSVFS